MKKIIFILFLLLSLNAQANNGYWDLDTIIRNIENQENIILNSGLNKISLSKEYLNNLKEIKSRISKQAGVYPKFLISDSSDINAFATWENGQPVAVFTIGLIQSISNDYDALAAVIGHEYSHLVLNHGSSRATAGAVIELLSGLAMIAINSSYGGATYNPYQGVYQIGLDVASKAAMSAYTRSEEIDADILGVKFIIDAGYSADGAVRLHESIIPSSSSFFSTHPSSETRIQNIKDAALGKSINVNNKTVTAFSKNVSNAYLQDSKYTSFAKNCTEEAINPNTSQFDVCVFKKLRESRKKIELNIDENLPENGQIGFVVSVENNRVIISSNIPYILSDATELLIEGKSGFYKCKVVKSFDGYYLAILEVENSIKVGNKVFTAKN